jgi:hypothetical protein
MRHWSLFIKTPGWNVGWGVSALDPEGRTIWIADAHRGDGKRFVEVASVLVRLDNVASIIVNANHSIM